MLEESSAFGSAWGGSRRFIHLFLLIVICLSGQRSFASDLIGWAAADALGTTTTTGGDGGPVVTVTTWADLVDYASRSGPYVIRVNGWIVDPNTKSAPLKVTSNKTLVGMGSTSGFQRFGPDLNGVSNVIIRNLTIYKATADSIALRNSHHVWIDHCTLNWASDGLIDITKESDYVTVSWVHFTNHSKCTLVSSGTGEPNDAGKLHVTYHHCWFDGTVQRNPRVGYGVVQVFNCLYNNNTDNTMLYCVGTFCGARVLVENSYFDQVPNPIQQSYSSDPDSTYYGHCEERGNIFNACTGSKDDDGIGFETDDAYLYAFNMDAVAGVPDIVQAGAGVHAEYGAVPVLPIPGDGAINVKTQPQLAWTSDPHAISYNVYFGDTETPVFQTGTTTRFFAPGVLQPGSVYYWRVDTVTTTTTLTGNLWRFRTLSAKATFPSPLNGETNIMAEASLSWRAGANAISHDVYLGTTNPPPFVENVTTSTLTPNLSYDQTYYWRVDEVTSGGIVTGDLWSFTTKTSVAGGPGRMEAEDMMLNNGYYVEIYAPASGGKWVGVANANGSIMYFHLGDAGYYDIKVTYWDEDDGLSPYSLYVGGELVGSWVADANPTGGGFVTKTFPSVWIDHYCDIRLVGSMQGGELARVDYIETEAVNGQNAVGNWLLYE
jgi:pectate lyase